MTANGLVVTLSRFKYVLIGLALSSCANAFRSFTDPGAEDYRLDKAQACLDEFDFDCAVENIDPVLEDNPNNETVVRVAISAYSGRSNLRVLDLIQEISDGLSSTNLFVILADHFPSATEDHRKDLEHAVDILEAYNSDASTRSQGLNLFAFFLYYGQIGVILSDYAYNGGAVVDPSWDACSNSDLNLPDPAAQRISRSFAHLVDISNNMSGNEAITDAFSSLSGPIALLGLTKTTTCPDVNPAVACTAVRTMIDADNGLGFNIGNCP